MEVLFILSIIVGALGILGSFLMIDAEDPFMCMVVLLFSVLLICNGVCGLSIITRDEGYIEKRFLDSIGSYINDLTKQEMIQLIENGKIKEDENVLEEE